MTFESFRWQNHFYEESLGQVEEKGAIIYFRKSTWNYDNWFISAEKLSKIGILKQFKNFNM